MSYFTIFICQRLRLLSEFTADVFFFFLENEKSFVCFDEKAAMSYTPWNKIMLVREGFGGVRRGLNDLACELHYPRLNYPCTVSHSQIYSHVSVSARLVFHNFRSPVIKLAFPASKFTQASFQNKSALVDYLSSRINYLPFIIIFPCETPRMHLMKDLRKCGAMCKQFGQWVRCAFTHAHSIVHYISHRTCTHYGGQTTLTTCRLGDRTLPTVVPKGVWNLDLVQLPDPWPR